MDRKYEGLCKPSLLHMDFLYESGHLGIVGNPAGMTQLIMYPKKYVLFQWNHCPGICIQFWQVKQQGIVLLALYVLPSSQGRDETFAANMVAFDGGATEG